MTSIFHLTATLAKPRKPKRVQEKRGRRFEALMMQSFADVQSRTPHAA